MKKWQDLFDNRTAREIKGAGFSVRLYSQGNLRYAEANRCLTLLTDIVDETHRLGKKWLIFPNTVLVLYVPTSLKWDDGAPVESSTRPVLTSRILEAIASAGEPARVEISDEVYRQAERDFESFGPGRATEKP